MREIVQQIEGVVSTLMSRQDKPQGYPISKVTIWTKEKLPLEYMFQDKLVLSIEVHDPEGLDDMLRLNFKVAGPIVKGDVQKIKGLTPTRVTEGWSVGGYTLPEGAYSVRSTLPPLEDDVTHTSRLFRVTIEVGEEPDAWEAVQFRKEVKEYLTEELKWDFTPEIFKAPRVWDEGGSTQDTLYVKVRFLDGPERVYQALEMYDVFKSYPIWMHLPTRVEMVAYTPKDKVVKLRGCTLEISRKKVY